MLSQSGSLLRWLSIEQTKQATHGVFVLCREKKRSEDQQRRGRSVNLTEWWRDWNLPASDLMVISITRLLGVIAHLLSRTTTSKTLFFYKMPPAWRKRNWEELFSPVYQLSENLHFNWILMLGANSLSNWSSFRGRRVSPLKMTASQTYSHWRCSNRLHAPASPPSPGISVSQKQLGLEYLSVYLHIGSRLFYRTWRCHGFVMLPLPAIHRVACVCKGSRGCVCVCCVLRSRTDQRSIILIRKDVSTPTLWCGV